MVSTKISLTDEQLAFLKQHVEIGFADRSALVREAIDRMRAEIERKKLEASAELYAEIYASDPELAALTDQAAEGWPE
jgi:Arc/MetJ-type ribon-helix-helix transcriptional regulator